MWIFWVWLTITLSLGVFFPFFIRVLLYTILERIYVGFIALHNIKVLYGRCWTLFITGFSAAAASLICCRCIELRIMKIDKSSPFIILWVIIIILFFFFGSLMICRWVFVIQMLCNYLHYTQKTIHKHYFSLVEVANFKRVANFTPFSYML